MGPISEEDAPNHPLVHFKIHAGKTVGMGARGICWRRGADGLWASCAAVSTNEIFLLVGDLISRVMCICEANGRNLQAALQVS